VPIRVLGPAQVVGPDGATRALERKSRELLTVLALRAPAAVGVDELAELLWDDPPPSATKTLQAHVSRLRSALAEATDGAVEVARSGPAYALRAPEDELDVAVVARERDEGRSLFAAGRADDAAAVLRRARAQWRGEIELPTTTGATAMAARWSQEHRQLVDEHLAAIVAGSAPGDAVPELHALTAADPLREPAWAMLVTALHRSGQHAASLRTFQAAREALAEVGLEPGVALRRAEQEVLRPPADDDAAPTAPAGPAGPSGPIRAYEVRYAVADGRHVAYTVIGGDDPDVVVLNPGAVSIDGIAGGRHLAHAIDRLAAGHRVIAFDRGGLGLSDRRGDAPALADWVADTVAVLDATGARRPVLLANADTGLVALSLAASAPDRVAAVVLVHGYARYVRGDGYPFGVDAETALATSSDVLAVDDRPDRFDPLSHIAPSVAGDDEFRAWWDAMGRRAASPAGAAAIHDAVYRTDVRDVLAAVAVPVLLLHRRSCASSDIGHARYLADHLPDARLRLLAGPDELWFTGDVDELLGEVDGFLAELG